MLAFIGKGTLEMIGHLGKASLSEKRFESKQSKKVDFYNYSSSHV